jgi:hypothetical protein
MTIPMFSMLVAGLLGGLGIAEIVNGNYKSSLVQFAGCALNLWLALK